MNKTTKTILFSIWIILMAWGIMGVIQRLSLGHRLADYGSYIPWGLWVAGKIYFVGMAVGSSFMAWVIYSFRIRRLQPLVRPALLLGIVCMIMGLVVISFDLGHMWRMYEVFLRPNFSSLLAISSWFSVGYLGYMIVVFFAEIKFGEIRRESFRPLGWIGIIFAVAFSGANGAEFATLISNPYWHSPLGPILSIAGALLSGLALLLAVLVLFPENTAQRDPEMLSFLSKVLVGLILFVLLLEWSEFSVSMWYARNQEFRLLNSILFGPYWYVFWVIHIAFGSIIPLFLLFYGSGRRLPVGLGSGLAAIGYFGVRLNHVIPGQVTPQLKGLAKAYVDHRLKFQYVPTMHEWSVFAFSVALGIALFYLVRRYLPALIPFLASREGR